MTSELRREGLVRSITTNVGTNILNGPMIMTVHGAVAKAGKKATTRCGMVLMKYLVVHVAGRVSVVINRLFNMKHVSLLMGLCAFLVAAPMLVTFTNGYGQFGCRHFVPMFPFLLVMMAQRPLPWWGPWIIGLSVFSTTFGIVSVHEYGLGVPW